MSTEALALLEKYERKPKTYPCPDDLRELLKGLSDFAKAGRKLSRAALEKEIRDRGHNVGISIISHWIRDAGGESWFAR